MKKPNLNLERSEIGAMGLKCSDNKELRMFFILPHYVMETLGETDTFSFVDKMMCELYVPKLLQHKVKEINIDVTQGINENNVQLNFNPFEELETFNIPKDFMEHLSKSDFTVPFEIIEG